MILNYLLFSLIAARLVTMSIESQSYMRHVLNSVSTAIGSAKSDSVLRAEINAEKIRLSP